MLNVKKTLTHLLNNLLYRTQRGYYSASTAITAGGYADYTITFPRAYDNVPVVVATLTVDSASTSAENAKLEPFIIDTTTSQVKIRVINSSSISRTPAFTWIAVGKIGGDTP